MSLCFIAIVNLISDKSIDIDEILNKFDANFVNPIELEGQTNKFNGISNSIKGVFLPYIGGMYIFSAVIGLFFSKTMLFFSFDTKWKFFRYGNNWQYLFSGKILKFKQHLSSDFNHKLKVKYTYLDILVSEKGDETTLYSGFFADYDICAQNISKLEKIHLLKATRYKKTNDGVVTRNIPGNLFTIMGERILNINCTYICFNEDESLNKKFLTRKKILVPVQILTTVSFIAVAICFIFSLQIIDNIYYNTLLSQPFYDKLVILFILNIGIGLLTPFEIDSENKKINFIGWEKYLSKIVLIFLSIGSFFYAIPFLYDFFKSVFL